MTDNGADQHGDASGATILTATYKSDFPGDYLVYVEEVHAIEHGRGDGVPITGSPFALTITTDDIYGKSPTTAPTLDVNSLPVCGSPQDTAEGIRDTFWRPGTWLSSNVASPAHGVLRDGWVFQPQTCAYDACSYDDLMHLSALDEPTWMLILGGSVQRGVFLSLVDIHDAGSRTKGRYGQQRRGKVLGIRRRPRRQSPGDVPGMYDSPVT